MTDTNLGGTTVVGIDLGTTYSLASLWRDGRAQLAPNALGEYLTPSVVSVDEDGSILVGRAAAERLQTHPESTASQFKRAMGTDRVYRLGKHRFRAEELSALVLRALKEDIEAFAGYRVQAAVITVPAYFSDAQRHATRSAGSLAGFSHVTLLNEPTAAALAYGIHQQHAETQFLVFDLGGGTFDVSVLQIFDGVMEVRATAGDNRLGGNDVDTALLDMLLKRTHAVLNETADAQSYQITLARVEAAKRALGQLQRVDVVLVTAAERFESYLSQDDLEAVLKSFAARLRRPVERALRDARIDPAQLDAIVLAGGSTKLSAVRGLVAKMFGRFPEASHNPDEVVARGAAVQAGLLMNDVSLAERVMTDVCPYSLGVEVSQQLEFGGYAPGFMSVILERNTVVPASRSQSYAPLAEGQKLIRLRVFQGENRRVDDNIHLGDLQIELPHGRHTEVGVGVRFTYDASGLLEVEATPQIKGESVSPPIQLVIQSSGQRLSSDEIAARLAALQEIKVHPRHRMHARTLLARAERLYAQLLGNQRDLLGAATLEFEAALHSQDDSRISRQSTHLEALLGRLDRTSLADPEIE